MVGQGAVLCPEDTRHRTVPRPQAEGKTWTWRWTYDSAGNILTRKEYGYDTGDLTSATPVDTVNYVYGNTSWGDLLTSFDGQAITYDGIGNPTSIGSRTFTWQHGRELASLSEDGVTWSYTYDADGMRVKRTNGSTTYKYYYAGGQLLKMYVTGYNLFFAYDAGGAPMSVYYDGAHYTYVTNLQGDVIAILDSTGTAVVTYTYDAWGRILATGGTMASTLGVRNPLRYRGYVYDQETGLYYLQSRYYDPEMGRFLNADAFTSTGQGFLGHNMFAYCLNDPVNFSDEDGEYADDYAGWGGQEIGIFLYELITGEDHPAREARELEEEVIAAQAGIIAGATESLWDAYQRGYALEQESIMLQAKMNVDMFDSSEDIERSFDIIEATLGFSTAAYGVAVVAIAANPPVGAVVAAVVGLIWGTRGLIRSLQ